jgi:aminoglycoside phosphotransferase family enzyme/predicted kinase
MELSYLIENLATPAAYPYPVSTVEVRQTHISAVFLAGEYVYKLKKPVAPGFLDFATLDKRLHFCTEEVRLNRRLAPDVYLGVVPVVQTPAGLRFEGTGEAIEWAVKMRRLPEESTLLQLLRRGEVSTELVETLATRISVFHREAETSERIAACGRFEAVSRNFLDIFERAAPSVGLTIGSGVFERVRALVEASLTRLRALIDQRAARRVTRDCHGDLHLDHIYCFPEKPPPGDLVIIDCIEFNEQLRAIDPVADMAFAAMDFAFYGRRDLARTFSNAYFLVSADEEGRAILPLSTAYRAAIRGMVDGLLLAEKEVPPDERTQARARARAHWLLALAELESPGSRPCLVLVGGLPGTGKSILCRMLAERAQFVVIRSDVVRKELAGLPTTEPAPSQARESLYDSERTARTYAECLNRAEKHLAEGRRVIVDATFRQERQRRSFVELAIHCGLPVAMLMCEAPLRVLRERLEKRKHDASDADWAVCQQAAASWEKADAAAQRVTHRIGTEGTAEQTFARAYDVLRVLELVE